MKTKKICYQVNEDSMNFIKNVIDAMNKSCGALECGACPLWTASNGCLAVVITDNYHKMRFEVLTDDTTRI